jgi:hypothetical protein
LGKSSIIAPSHYKQYANRVSPVPSNNLPENVETDIKHCSRSFPPFSHTLRKESRLIVGNQYVSIARCKKCYRMFETVVSYYKKSDGTVRGISTFRMIPETQPSEANDETKP